MLLHSLHISWGLLLQALFCLAVTAFFWFLIKLYNVRKRLLAFRKKGLV